MRNEKGEIRDLGLRTENWNWGLRIENWELRIENWELRIVWGIKDEKWEWPLGIVCHRLRARHYRIGIKDLGMTIALKMNDYITFNIYCGFKIETKWIRD